MFTKATKSQARLRCACFGPAGAGKTFSCLRIAAGLAAATAGRVALIDTERGSASKYADRFEFDTCALDNRTIDGYLKALEAAAEAGYAVLIIDSLSHAWQELLADMNRIARARFGGNTWAAWSEGTPRQRRFVDALVQHPAHVLATIRSKTEWTQQTNERGKAEPVRVGLAPEQGKGIEFEFDLLLELNTDHTASILKDRTGKFQDAIIECPGEVFGAELAAWLAEGTPAPAPAPYTPTLPAIDQAMADLTDQLRGDQPQVF